MAGGSERSVELVRQQRDEIHDSNCAQRANNSGTHRYCSEIAFYGICCVVLCDPRCEDVTNEESMAGHLAASE